MATRPKIVKAFEFKQGPQVNTGRGKTEQAHKNECDMNFILKEYQRTGFIRHAKENKGRYDDVSVQDFQEAMFIVKEAEEMFNQLPAGIRKGFEHDPARFLEYVQDPANHADMARRGILKGNDGIDISGAASGAPVAEEKAPAEPPPPAPQQ